MECIHTVGLTKAYHGKRAVDSLEMRVEPGDIYGFIGQNGAGKSTTFKLLSGLARPTGGEISLFGHPVGDETTRRRIGILIEDAGVYPGFSASENLLLKANLVGLPHPAQEVARVLAEVGLADAGAKPAKRFSMGMRRRLGLALALLGNPDLLLLDEPINGLDPEGIRDVRALLQSLQQQHGMTIVISSHILGELSKVATRYGIIRQGKMVEELTAEALSAKCRDYLCLQTTDPRKAAALLEETLNLHDYEVLPAGELHIFGNADPAAINTILNQKGLAVQSIAPHRQDLEEYFLQRMEVGNHA
ncbi:MAG: ATP-binding cassette domain-containing protein [Gemmiger sp.]|nr:ATP-binding cassette domain-containing protein [Gemmiger sp.]